MPVAGEADIDSIEFGLVTVGLHGDQHTTVAIVNSLEIGHDTSLIAGGNCKYLGVHVLLQPSLGSGNKLDGLARLGAAQGLELADRRTDTTTDRSCMNRYTQNGTVVDMVRTVVWVSG